MKVIEPVNWLASVPPNVTSPLVLETEVAGSKEIDTESCEINPLLKRRSVTECGKTSMTSIA